MNIVRCKQAGRRGCLVPVCRNTNAVIHVHAFDTLSLASARRTFSTFVLTAHLAPACMHAHVRARVRTRARARVRACVRACVRECERACVRVVRARASVRRCVGSYLAPWLRARMCACVRPGFLVELVWAINMIVWELT
eukprot:1234026-Pleurochrysis_carterae.AAC.1